MINLLETRIIKINVVEFKGLPCSPSGFQVEMTPNNDLLKEPAGKR